MHCVVVVILLDTTGHYAYYGPITIDGARMNIMNNSKEELKDTKAKYQEFYYTKLSILFNLTKFSKYSINCSCLI